MKEDIRKFVFEKFPMAKSRGVSDSAQLLEEGILDSMGILELVNFLSEDLGLDVEDEELVPENFASIDAIAGFVETKRAAKTA